MLEMIEIKKATRNDSVVLALLGRITYIESHAHFIKDNRDLNQYANDAFSVSTIEKDLLNPKILFHILYINKLPVGYTKLVLNTKHENIISTNNIRLERIYILNEFIPMKVGQQLLSFAEEKAKVLMFDTIWLSVYIKNERAIKFYHKNQFKSVGRLDFLVNGTVYENYVLSKKL
jgi:Acetyltransferases